MRSCPQSERTRDRRALGVSAVLAGEALRPAGRERGPSRTSPTPAWAQDAPPRACIQRVVWFAPPGTPAPPRRSRRNPW